MILEVNTQALNNINMYFSKFVGKAPWNIYSGTGSIMALNFGKMKHDKWRYISEFHILIENANWELLKNQEIHVNSKSSRLDILEKITLPIGKVLSSFKLDLHKNEYQLFFSYDIELRIKMTIDRGVGDFCRSRLSDMLVFLPQQTVIFGPGLFYSIENTNNF